MSLSGLVQLLLGPEAGSDNTSSMGNLGTLQPGSWNLKFFGLLYIREINSLTSRGAPKVCEVRNTNKGKWLIGFRV